VARDPIELLSFRRTFALLLLLVALPSAALSGFGVIAIINERAAVEKRLSLAWGRKLEVEFGRLRTAFARASMELRPHGLSVFALGRPLTRSEFVLGPDGHLRADATTTTAVDLLIPELLGVREPGFLSATGPEGSVLVAAMRGSDGVHGALVDLDAIDGLLQALASDLEDPAEPVRFTLLPVQRVVGEGLVGKLMQAREAALSTQPLAERTLPPPFQEFRLAALPLGSDPVAYASTRNRVLYGILLGVFLATLAIGVAYTARVLYREAQLSRLKTDFVSLVSHELRTPLTSIRMFIEMLSLGRVTDQAQTQQVLEMLAKETERLSAMIEGVLDWARLESGRKRYQIEPAAVPSLVEAAVTAFRTQRLDATVKLSVEVPEALPKVLADHDAIAGALLNLLQNAFKYSGEDKRIAVRARVERHGVAIEVEDNGVGIAVREHRRIFERFYRVDDRLTRSTEGSGLGLAISRRIVEAHGGRITLRSEPGQGSVFTIHLKAAEA
jgi:two-component system phosphate regulon sensor histidine kinase PhoR